MEILTDGLLLAASIVATGYCYILSKRLRRFTTLETGMGGAIAVLSAQVDDMTQVLEKARQTASGAEIRLKELTQQAATQARRLELMTAALHDLPSDERFAAEPQFERKDRPRVLRRRNHDYMAEAAE